jgi:hypothetical protein
MKTAEEILEELELVAKDSIGAFLFVVFEDNSIILSLYDATEVLPDGRVVCEIDPKFLSLLKEAIDNGGVPIGWYRLKSEKRAGDIVELGALQEQNEPWVYDYLRYFFTREDKKHYKEGTRYFLVYPDGLVSDITRE